MFLLIRGINRADEALDEHFGSDESADKPANKKCPYCRETIAYLASRCPQCTSELDEPATSGS